MPAAAGIQGRRTLFFFERCKRHVGELPYNKKSFKIIKKKIVRVVKYLIEIGTIDWGKGKILRSQEECRW